MFACHSLSKKKQQNDFLGFQGLSALPCLLETRRGESPDSGGVYWASDTPCSSTSASCFAILILTAPVLLLSSADNITRNLAIAFSTLPALRLSWGALRRAASRIGPSFCSVTAGGTGEDEVQLVVPTLCIE